MGCAASASHRRSRPGPRLPPRSGRPPARRCTACRSDPSTSLECEMPRMFLNGTAMSGGADHHLVGGAELVARTTTAKRYRFHAVDGRYPGLEDVGDGGAAVEGEVYELSYEQLREVLLPGEPAGLELGRNKDDEPQPLGQASFHNPKASSDRS